MKKIGYLFVHEMALFISDIARYVCKLGDWLWEKGGNLEGWADMKLVEEQRKWK